MKIYVLGPNGMLGRAVCEAAEQQDHVVYRGKYRLGGIEEPDYWDSDAIINCAGVRPGADEDVEMVLTNAYGPHELAASTQIRQQKIVHVSTDCVFSGKFVGVGHRYRIADLPDPVDIYGRSKLLGEVNAPNVYNVRTSFIGPDHGLLRYLLNCVAKGELVDGWRHAFWTGSTVWAVARELVAIADGRHEPDTRLVHLSTLEKYSKLEVLRMLRDELGLNAVISTQDNPVIDRALQPTIILPPLDRTLPELAEKVCTPVS